MALAGRAAIYFGFHPLKAGRRPEGSIVAYEGYYSFPSPQGGSETPFSNELKGSLRQFPSPQGGSETPSLFAVASICLCFHPLKAGRRLNILANGDVEIYSFHPLKAGRRR